MRTSAGSRGEDGGAHSGVGDGLSELGEAETAANRRVWLPATEEEEGDNDGSTGRPVMHDLVER